MSPTNRSRRATAALACLYWVTSAAPAAAGVLMQVRDLPGSQDFLPDFFVESSTPVSLSGVSGDGFAAGHVTYDSLGLHASIDMPARCCNVEQSFGVWVTLRYDDLQITSDDGADFVSGVVNLDFDGTSVIETSNSFRNQHSYLINPSVSTASGGLAASVSRSLSAFGDDMTSNGWLSGYDGNGSISVAVPVVFSTTSPEFLQIELQIRVRLFVRSGENARVDVNFANTLALADPSQIITFTDGLNPTLNSTTGEIVNNALAVPEPARFVLVLLVCAGLAASRRS